ncbi:MAG TPA: hypothetical protein PLB87_07920, partial [Prolixibacteraceae bacterium]|nr:hypothetical protein [Prolixibacteraceae bacterium]
MKNIKPIPLLIAAFICSTVISCNPAQEKRIKTGDRDKVDYKVLPFELTDVKLLDGPFKHATELDEKTLLNYQPDRLL